MAERRRLAGVARQELDGAALIVLQHLKPSAGIERLVKAVVHGLADERMIRDIDVAVMVFQAADSGGKGGGEQIVGAEPLEEKRHLFAVLEAEHHERAGDIPTPPQRKHRHREQRLLQHFLAIVRPQHLEQLFQREAVLRSDRQQDAVVRGGRLQLEIETAAKPLAQREPPGLVHTMAERRVDRQLHSTRFVKEPLENHLPHRGNNAGRGDLRPDVPHRLGGRPVVRPAIAPQPFGGQRLVAARFVGRRRPLEDRRQFAPHLGQLFAQLGRPTRRLAEPKRHVGRRPMGVPHAHFLAAHSRDLPRG